MISPGLYHSLTSGGLAASATLFGKLAMSPSFCGHFIDFNEHSYSWHSSDINSIIVNTYRVLMFALMVIINALMWTQFTKALNRYTNSLHVIVVNTATNFFVTAIFGKLFFAERLSTIWWIGSTFIVIGLFLMKTSDSDQKKDKNK